METIIDGVTGVFFDQQEPESLAAAIQRFEEFEWSEKVLRSHARSFSVEVFQMRMRTFLSKIGVRLHEDALASVDMEEKTA